MSMTSQVNIATRALHGRISRLYADSGSTLPDNASGSARAFHR